MKRQQTITMSLRRALGFNERKAAAESTWIDGLPARVTFGCVLIYALLAMPVSGQSGTTFDGGPVRPDWQKIRLAQELHATAYVGSTGAVGLMPDGTWMEVCSAPFLQYAPGLTADVKQVGQETAISVTGTVAQTWEVHQEITVHTNGVSVHYILTALRDNVPPPTLQGHTGDPFMWQRFVGESDGRQVWGYLMEMRGADRVHLSRWMEVGPVQYVLASYEFGENTVLTLKGWDETPATHHGFLTGHYEWTQTESRSLKKGEKCEFAMKVLLRPHSRPWKVKPETVTRVIPPREMNFLNPAPHASGMEIEPEGVCAPVFGINQPVRLRLTMRISDAVPPKTQFVVTDALDGKEVGKGETPTIRQGGATRAMCEWQAPRPGVYDFDILGHDGHVPYKRRYQVAVVGPVEQPVMKRGDKLPLCLADTIRCGKADDPHPFWSSAADTRIVESPLGAYRETGAAAGSWMQYRIEVKPHRIYIVETDYPDDADRTTSISIAEPNDPDAAKPWGMLRSTSGYATGTVFPLTQKRESFRFVYFSGDTTWATVNIMNPCPIWKTGAVTEIRLYELDGELPRVDLPESGGRTLALYTESGNVAFGSLYTGQHFRTHEDSWGVISEDNYYREWYGMAVNLVKYLRYTGQDGYVCGLYRYDSPYYPSRQYSHPIAPFTTADYTALLAKMFEYNGLKLYPSVMTTRTWPGTVRHGNRTQYEVVNEGEHTAVNVGPDGQQDIRTFLASVPALNPGSPELHTELANMAEEIAGRYAPFKSVRGIFWLCGGAWQPFYTVQGGFVNEESATRYSYDDDSMTRFFKELGKPLPADPKDPERFQKRYAYIKANARDAWMDFRCKLIAECHEVIADRIHKVSPNLVYYPCEVNNVIHAMYRSGGTPYAALKLHAMNPALYSGKDNLVYVHHNWDLALLKDGMSEGGMTPEKMKSVAYPLHLRELLDPELNGVYERTAPHVGAFLQRQFQEYGYVQPANVPPCFYQPSPALAQLRWPICANIEYAQPANWRWLHDFTLMFARTTPEFVAWMWCDGRIPMGHEEQIQYLAAFIRSLPLGRFKAIGETSSGVFARAQLAETGKPRVLYLVNTSLEPQVVVLRGDGNAMLTDRVTGKKIPGNGGAWTIPLDRAALRSFTLGTGVRDIRLETR